MGLRPTQGDERSEAEGPAVLLFIPNRSVIPTEAYPDFLPRCTGHDHVCALP
jgi:hypothetical protein